MRGTKTTARNSLTVPYSNFPLFRSNNTMSEPAPVGSSNRLAPENQFLSLLGDNEIVVEGYVFQTFNTYEELLDSVRKEERDQIRVRPYNTSNLNTSATFNLLNIRLRRISKNLREGEHIFLVQRGAKTCNTPLKSILKSKTLLRPSIIYFIEMQLLLTPPKPPRGCPRYHQSNRT